MYLTKKKKLILAWTIPAAAVVAGVAIAAPIVIINEVNNKKTFNDAPLITPLGFNQINDQQYLDSLVYNPQNFDINFFTSKIQESSAFANNVFYFQEPNGTSLERVVSFDEKGQEVVVWKNKNGVQYQITSILPDKNTINDSSKEYKFNLTIIKSYNDNKKEYSQIVIIPADSFASKEESIKNFISSSSSILRDNLLKNRISLEVSQNKIETVTSIEKITQVGDVVVSPDSSNYFSYVEKSGQPSTYIANGSDFKYLDQTIEFSIPTLDDSNKLIFDSKEAYSFTAKDKFNTSSPLFTFLQQAEKAGNLTYLPKLSDEEKNGLSPEQIKERQIQKLIFDPTLTPGLNDEFGNKVPSNPSQAVVIKVLMGDKFTYLVTWANLFKPSPIIVENAEELKMIVKQNNGTLLTANQISDPKFYKFIQPETQPTDPSLVYKVKNVEFASDDKYKTKAIVTVEISSTLLLPNITKEYKTEITTGFASIAYEELDKQIKKILNSSTNLNAVTPTIKLAKGVVPDEFLKRGENELDKFEQDLIITPPPGLANVIYKLVSVRISGNTFEGTFKIASSNDPDTYWQVNDTEQVVRAKLVVSQTT